MHDCNPKWIDLSSISSPKTVWLVLVEALLVFQAGEVGKKKQKVASAQITNVDDNIGGGG